jgi:hypothetical protein
MMDFIKSDRAKAVIATLDIDPAPSDRYLNSLSIRKDSGAVKVSVVDDRLEITGDSSRIETFADWFNFADDTSHGYHHHHNGLCGEKMGSSTIHMPLVITC